MGLNAPSYFRMDGLFDVDRNGDLPLLCCFECFGIGKDFWQSRRLGTENGSNPLMPWQLARSAALADVLHIRGGVAGNGRQNWK